MAIIAPSILAADFANLRHQLQLIERAGAKWVHIDVMDGKFVPNITFGPVIVAAVRKMTNLFLDVHLMVHEPDFIIPQYREAGADLITVHVEAIKHLYRTIQLIKHVGAQVGLSLNPATSAHCLEPVISEVDLILAMTVNPGFGGQEFIPAVVPKIAQIDSMIRNQQRAIYLEVDGGIDSQTAPIVIGAGANVLVAGTAIFRQDDIAAAFQQLHHSFPSNRKDQV